MFKITNKVYAIISWYRQWRHPPWGDLKGENMWWEVNWKNLVTFIFNFCRVWSTFNYPGVNAKKRNQNCKFSSFFSTPLIIIRTRQVMKDWIFLIWDTVCPASHSAESRSLKTSKYTYHTVSEMIKRTTIQTGINF